MWIARWRFLVRRVPGCWKQCTKRFLHAIWRPGVCAWHGKFPSPSGFAASGSTKRFVQTSSWRIPVLVELKSVEKVTKAHHRQVLTYPRLTGIGLRHLLNFGEALMRDGISRIINGDIEQISLRRALHFLRVLCASV